MKWPKVKLVEICNPKQWKTISTEMLTQEGYHVYGANGIIGKYSAYTHEFPTVMITCRGATCGNVHISEPQSYINGNAMALDNLSSKVNLRFLYHYLSSYNFKSVISGSAQPQITLQGLQKIELPLPPLPIQQQIADTLDKADALRQKDQELLDKYDELAQAVFYEMFGDPVTNEKGWEITSMEIACKKVTDGTHDTPSRYKRGIPFITGKHIRAGIIDYENCDYVDEKVHEEIYKRCNPELGDVLYTNIGVNFGTAALNTMSYEFSMKNVALLKPNSSYLKGEFLEALLNNPKYKDKTLNSLGLGGAQQFLSLKQIRSMPILIPPLELQVKYSIFLSNLKSTTNCLNRAMHYSSELFNSLLIEYLTS